MPTWPSLQLVDQVCCILRIFRQQVPGEKSGFNQRNPWWYKLIYIHIMIKPYMMDCEYEYKYD